MKGLSASDLSRITGIDNAQISRWLSGKNTPVSKSIINISKALTCRIKKSAGVWSVELLESKDFLLNEPEVPYIAIPSTAATLEDLERMLELVESTVRIARASITELSKKS